jgi:hypothetical protein
MKSTLKRPLSLLMAGAAALAALANVPAFGQPAAKHLYTFNNNSAADTGTAAVKKDGTVVDLGAVTARYDFGQLNLSANTGQASNAVTNDAWVDLPNLMMEEAVNSGTVGAITFEYWFTIATQRTWARIGDFAGPAIPPIAGSEGVTNNGTGSYFMMTPASGRAGNVGIEMTNQVGGAGESFFGNNTSLPVGQQIHVVAVYDRTDLTRGPGGSMHLYRDGVLQTNTVGGANGAIQAAFNMEDLNDEDNWLGRSQWPDPVFDGLYNEFAVYDVALSAADVTARFNAGPVGVPLPKLVIDAADGDVKIVNGTTGVMDFDYYEIRSPGGRLNTATWNSLSDQNKDAAHRADFDNSGTPVNGADLTAWKASFGVDANADFDNDGDSDGRDFIFWQRSLGQTAGEGDSWDEAGGVSANLLAEAFLTGSSKVNAGGELSLGKAFTPGASETGLAFFFALKGGGLFQGQLEYAAFSTPASSGIPEPTAASLAMVGLGVLSAAYRRRRS